MLELIISLLCLYGVSLYICIKAMQEYYSRNNLEIIPISEVIYITMPIFNTVLFILAVIKAVTHINIKDLPNFGYNEKFNSLVRKTLRIN